ncbi:cytochrome c553 [Salinisphaera dokdonensis CL-ES53]|uniref:Cytochrome c553 n=1 Tax=Salinisphaera dokdonensis CL-ES53 TaxID=1304272 RepID=A0ABV2B072_9GAMM
MRYRAIGVATTLVTTGLVLGMASGVANAAAPTGADLASACTACHGSDGQSQGAVPSLAGLKPQTFIERMQAFQNGEGTIMNRIAPAYDDAQIAALAEYFATRDSAKDEHRHAP